MLLHVIEELICEKCNSFNLTCRDEWGNNNAMLLAKWRNWNECIDQAPWLHCINFTLTQFLQIWIIFQVWKLPHCKTYPCIFHDIDGGREVWLSLIRIAYLWIRQKTVNAINHLMLNMSKNINTFLFVIDRHLIEDYTDLKMFLRCLQRSISRKSEGDLGRWKIGKFSITRLCIENLTMKEIVDLGLARTQHASEERRPPTLGWVKSILDETGCISYSLSRWLCK